MIREHPLMALASFGQAGILVCAALDYAMPAVAEWVVTPLGVVSGYILGTALFYGVESRLRA